MIVLITTRGNGYTFKSLVNGTFGVATPKLRTTHYEKLFGSWVVPRATYVFGDIERLAAWELRLAAMLYRSMTEAGLKCLNDPARAMSRVQLLTTLREAGFNPFSVFRADTAPRPQRFPVFVRGEEDHLKPSSDLYFSQEELDRALAALSADGTPLRGMLVVEQAAARYNDALWAKWGTWRIGSQTITEHIAVDDVWLVKTGDHAKVSEAVALDENDAVVSNRFVGDLSRAFELADIEFGRADHAVVDGKTVVYEVNTNPFLGWFVPDRNPVRRQTQLTARGRIADALAAIDTQQRGWVRIAGAKRRPYRWWRPGFKTPRRP
jgi:hypothetical protein